MNLIVAVDRDWGIGYKGDLLARVREDLRNFAKVTSGKIVVYGTNTLATFPGGKVLKNRINIILNPSPDFKVEGAIVANSLDDLFKKLESYNKDDIFVIGGASVYNQLLPYCTKAYVTKFDKSFDKDTYIPNLDESDDWICVYESEEFRTNPETDTGGDFSFKFTIYEKTGKTK